MKQANAVRRTVPPSAEIQDRIDGLLPRDGQLLATGMASEDPQRMLSELAKLGARLIIQRAVEELGSGPVRTLTAVEVDLIVGDQSLPRHLARILHIPRGLTGHQSLHEKERAALRKLARYLHQLHLIDATVELMDSVRTTGCGRIQASR